MERLGALLTDEVSILKSHVIFGQSYCLFE